MFPEVQLHDFPNIPSSKIQLSDLVLETYIYFGPTYEKEINFGIYQKGFLVFKLIFPA